MATRKPPMSEILGKALATSARYDSKDNRYETVAVSTRVPPEVRTAIERLCDKDGRSMSDHIRRAIYLYLRLYNKRATKGTATETD